MKKGAVTLLVLWLGHLLVDFQIGIFSVYKTMADLDLAKAGIVGIVAALFGEGCQAFFGSWSDSGHRKKLIILGMVLTAASSLMAYSDNYFLLTVLLLGTFIGSAAFHPSSAGLVGTLSKRKGLFFTIFASGGALGLAFSQISFYHAYQYLEGNTAILALPLMILAGACLFLPLDVISTGPRKPTRFSDLARLFKRADFRCLYYVQVCNQTLYWGTVFLLPDVLAATGYDESISFGGGHLAFIAGGALMMIPGGILADKYSPKTVILAAMIAGLVFFYSFLYAGLVHPIAILAILAGLGASFGVVSPVGLALGHRLLPTQPSLVSAFVMGMVWCVSESFAPASGILTKLFTEGNAPAKALMLMGLLNVVGVVAAYRLPLVAEEPEEAIAVTA
ncbi:MAG: MFS transporter [Chlamydiales bacterium]|nr:MFS transporter [Chlamydiales bacterium]